MKLGGVLAADRAVVALIHLLSLLSHGLSSIRPHWRDASVWIESRVERHRRRQVAEIDRATLAEESVRVGWPSRNARARHGVMPLESAWMSS